MIRSPPLEVEVFFAPSTPHMQTAAAEIEAKLHRQLEALPPASLVQLSKWCAELVRARAAFERFRHRGGF
jgi:hypothetical protein